MISACFSPVSNRGGRLGMGMLRGIRSRELKIQIGGRSRQNHSIPPPFGHALT